MTDPVDVSDLGVDAREEGGYDVAHRFGQLDTRYQLTGVPGLALDASRTVLWALARAVPTLFCLDLDGAIVKQFPLSLTRAHALATTRSKTVLVVDDARHVVEEFAMDGTLVRVLGVAHHPADTGYVGDDPFSVRRAGIPFNRPAGVTGSPDDSVLVADGYGNARIHRFEAGHLIESWGEPGSQPGQFRLPHGVTTDAAGRVYVADRENNRIQVFTAHGEYVREHTGLSRPCDVHVSATGTIYVGELDPEGGRVTILAQDGEVLVRFIACIDQPHAGVHAIDVDGDGNIYLGLVPRVEAELAYGMIKCRRR